MTCTLDTTTQRAAAPRTLDELLADADRLARLGRLGRLDGRVSWQERSDRDQARRALERSARAWDERRATPAEDLEAAVGETLDALNTAGQRRVVLWLAGLALTPGPLA